MNHLIASAESKYIKLLESFFLETGGKIVYSHNLGHHRRVWNNAKELLAANSNNGNPVSGKLAETLLIGCYLHDLGMCIDAGSVHGSLSADLCRQFLSRNGLAENDFPGLIRAIETHDRKEYRSASDPGNPATLLSVADDLDAFGYIGIYRYAEIYLARHIPRSELGFRILENSANRFANFSHVFADSPDLILKHRQKFLILRNFYDDYNIRQKTEGFEEKNISGHWGVICLISEMLTNNINPEDEPSVAAPYQNDQIIFSFFKNLISDLNQAHQLSH